TGGRSGGGGGGEGGGVAALLGRPDAGDEPEQHQVVGVLQATRHQERQPERGHDQGGAGEGGGRGRGGVAGHRGQAGGRRALAGIDDRHRVRLAGGDVELREQVADEQHGDGQAGAR